MRSFVASILSRVTPAVKAIASRRRLAIVLLAAAGTAALAGPRLLDRQHVLPAPTDGRVQQATRNDELSSVRRSLVQLATQPAASPPDALPSSWDRRIARRATLDLQLADVDQGVARLTALVESFGGFVGATESQSDAKGTVRATVSAYVPPDEFARALGGVDQIGRVTHRVIGGQDVSEEFVDLEARLRNFERHEAQLLAFMQRAQKVQDLLALESELARVRGEIERAMGRLRFLKARTELAIIQVSLVRAPLAAPPDGLPARVVEQVRQAFAEGWSTAFAVMLGLCVLAAQLSPLAVPAVSAWLIYRYRAARRQGSA